MDDGSNEISSSLTPGSPSGCSPGDLAGFGITRQIGSGPEVLIAATGTSGYFRDYMTKPGQPHTYRSYSFTWEGAVSADSAPVTITPNDVAAPPAPTLSANGVDLGAEVDFEACYDSDVLGGNVYSSTSSGGPYQKVNSQTIYASGNIHYTVTGLQNGVTYYLVATLVDQTGNEGAYSNEVAVTPGP
ncbi:MAG TPA: hypothetical protein ENJ50_03720 [Planctomycetaceae bacterium]|nr:hypothetical protein [Planctomycetaceae bacterium]